MMVEADLHLHTTRSDGRLSPAQLVDLLGQTSLKVVSITDHDTTEGLEEALRAAQSYPRLRIIPGVEISTDVAGGEVHILAYHVPRESQSFQALLERFRQGRYERGQGMLQKLGELGMPLDWRRVLEIAGDASIGRPHVARALVEKGYVATMQEAFDKYLGRNCPAYVEREKLTPEEAIQLALDNGALPVLAHPQYVHELESGLPSLKRAGLLGMEVYYGRNSQQEQGRLSALAARYDLVPLGGSDYHAMGQDGEALPGTVGPPLENVARLESFLAGRPSPR